MNVNSPAIVSGSDRPRFDVSSNGTSTQGGCEIAQTPTVDEWVLYVGRWDPSTETKIWLFEGGQMYTSNNTTSIPATLHRPSGANLLTCWGNFKDGTGNHVLDGYVSTAFFVPTAIPDAQIELFYEISRHIFGV